MSSTASNAENEVPKKQPSRMVKTFGAMTGGVIEACCLQPLDVTKTRLQLHNGPRVGALQIATTMVKTEGPLSLYKGLTPFCTHLVTKYSVRWYFNEFFRFVYCLFDSKFIFT